MFEILLNSCGGGVGVQGSFRTPTHRLSKKNAQRLPPREWLARLIKGSKNHRFGVDVRVGDYSGGARGRCLSGVIPHICGITLAPICEIGAIFPHMRGIGASIASLAVPVQPRWRKRPISGGGLASGECEDQVLDGPASAGKGSHGRHLLDCIRGKGRVSSGSRLSQIGSTRHGLSEREQGNLAHKKQPPPLGTPYDPRQGPAVGS